MVTELCASRDKQEELPDSIIDSIAKFHQCLNKWQNLKSSTLQKNMSMATLQS
jgi:hypothetical protein